MRTLRALLICGSAASLAIGILPAHASQTMLDPRFGQHGLAENGLGTPVSIAPGPAGTVVEGAVAFNAPDSYSSVVGRFTADGSPDRTFGAAGVTTLTGMGSGIEQVAIAPDGGVLAVGFDPNKGAFVDRLTPTGVLDPAFGTGGVVSLPRAEGVAVQPDGKILVVGLSTVYRLMPNGSRDLGFGVGGAWDLGNYPSGASFLQTVTVLSDGSILAGGYDGGSTGLWKLKPSGLPDFSYGTNGASTIDIEDPYSQSIWSEALHLLPQADGNVLVTGGIGTHDSPYVARVSAAGVFDRTFATNGVATFEADFGAATTSDGNAIYVTYSGESQGPTQITVTKLTNAGVVDPTFGNAGSLTYLGSYDSTIASGAFLRNGRLTIAADAPEALIRYILNGHPDA